MRKNLATLASIVFLVFPAFASALTLQDLQQQLRFVSSQLKTLYRFDGSIAVAAAGAGLSAPECPMLTRTLTIGDRDSATGGEVSLLQDFLVKKGEISPSEFTEVPKGYFGHLTQVALESWQTRNNLLATGKTDAVTRTSILTCADSELPKPVITLMADKEHAFAGEEVKLSWHTRHATQCSLEMSSDDGASTQSTVEPTGTAVVHLPGSATIRLSCVNNIGLETSGPEASESIRIVINEQIAGERAAKIMQAAAVLAAVEDVLQKILGH